MRVCVIPARGGSKRIPRKNMKSFLGKPMLAYAVDVARQAELFDAIVVSTDDDEIAALAASLGVDVVARPASLADDFTPTVPVIAHAIETLQTSGKAVKTACCIYPSAVFVQPADLRLAYQQLLQDNLAYVFPVTEFASAPQRALMRTESGKMQPLFAGFAGQRTQDLIPAFYDAGQFYWGQVSAWLAGDNIHQHGYGMVIPHWRVVDIDTPDDWRRAELYYQVLQHEITR